MHPKTEPNCSSALGPRHLNPMDILKHGLISRVFSRFLLTAVRILFFNGLIYCKNKASLKDGLVQDVSPSLTTKGDVFVY